MSDQNATLETLQINQITPHPFLPLNSNYNPPSNAADVFHDSKDNPVRVRVSPFLGIIVPFAASRQTSAPDRKLIFVGFTNVTGKSCGMFKFPGWYTPPRWIPHGSFSLIPEAHLQGDKGEDFGQVLDIFPKASTGFPATFIYAVAVPPGSTTMCVQIDEHIHDSIRLGIQIPFKEKTLRATSDIVQIPIDFQAPADRDLWIPPKSPSALPISYE